VYYNWGIAKHFQLTPDYQYAQNPAYNHVRGPVNIFALRFHTEEAELTNDAEARG